jgi:ankyrin repeat protein
MDTEDARYFETHQESNEELLEGTSEVRAGATLTTLAASPSTRSTKSIMDTLANEIIIMIASHLDAADQNAFLRANKQLMTLVTPLLYSTHGKYALGYATRNGMLSIVKALLETHDVDANFVEVPGTLTALHLAALHGKADIADLLLQHGADVFAIGGYTFGQTTRYKRARPLHLAARSGNVEIGRNILLFRGSEAVTAGVDEWADSVLTCQPRATALHIAAGCGHTEFVEMMLDFGAEEDMLDRNGASPLHYAAENNHLMAMLMLVKRGADRYKVDRGGNAPGLLAVLPLEVLEELLEDMVMQRDLTSNWLA